MPLTWVAGSTKVGPTNLNHLELGVQAAATQADSATAAAAAAQATASAALPTPAGSNGQFLKRVGGLWVPATFAISDIPDPTTGKVIGSSGSAAAAVFPPGYKYGETSITGNVSVTATSEAAANTVVTAPAIAFDGSTQVILEFFSYDVIKGTSNISLWLYDGSTSIGFIGFSTTSAPILVRRIFTPAAATKTYSIRASVDAGTGTVGAGAGGIGVGAPAYIRIVQA